MKKVIRALICLSGLVLWAVLLPTAWSAGQPSHDEHGRGNQREEHREQGQIQHPSYYRDDRFGHNRRYPSRGYVINEAPHGAVIIRHRGEPYYYHGGVWYRPSGPRFIVVAPPIGIVVPFLPSFYTTLWVGGVPYYYADATYYRWRPELNGYQVTAPPRENQVTVQTPSEKELYVYPAKGQGDEQQAKDRYECYRWAVDQSGFDPTEPQGNVAESEVAQKRTEYRRAESACLEGRGYTVK